MRRLIAHIGLALTALVLVGTTYTKVVSNVDSNIEFKNGKQLVFRATPKNSTYEDLKDGEVIEEDDLKSIIGPSKLFIIDNGYLYTRKNELARSSIKESINRS